MIDSDEQIASLEEQLKEAPKNFNEAEVKKLKHDLSTARRKVDKSMMAVPIDLCVQLQMLKHLLMSTMRALIVLARCSPTLLSTLP